MNTVKRILMERDGMTEKEAEILCNDVREEMMERIESGDCTDAEDIFESEFGLEPDYMINFLL